MAKISEILEIEKQRTEPATWNVIHLFKEGGFYRAYNWSAWLIVTFGYNDEVRSQTQDRKPLTVSRKKVKSGDGDFAFVGFPLKSLEKFLPYRNSFSPVSDTQIDVSVELPPGDDELSFESMQDAFEKWKQTVPISEEKQRREEDARASPRSITAVMAQVLAYPLEQKTPMENTAFISTLKQQLAALF